MSRFRGIHVTPGAYSMARRIDVANGESFAEVDFRSADWFGACPQLSFAERNNAQTRGEIRRVVVSFYSGSEVQIADEQDPGTRYCSVDATRPTMTRDFPNDLGVSSIFLNGTDEGGQDKAEILVYFDIPAEGDV